MAQGLGFLRVCKPESPQELYEWDAFLERSGAVQTRVVKRWTAQPVEDREHENNHTLKTKGYHFEHNYGHGHRHLSSLLATLILLAYLLHNLLEWMDDKFCLLRQKLPSRKRLFNDIRALTTYLCFDSWEALLDFMLRGWSSSPPPKPNTS